MVTFVYSPRCVDQLSSWSQVSHGPVEVSRSTTTTLWDVQLDSSVLRVALDH